MMRSSSRSTVYTVRFSLGNRRYSSSRRVREVRIHLCSCLILPIYLAYGVFLPPATKLGQGYIFTGVCDSVHGGGGGGKRGWGACVVGGMHGGGGCVWLGGGMCGRGHAWQGGWGACMTCTSPRTDTTAMAYGQ